MSQLSDLRPRFLSEADCHDIVQWLSRYANGGYTAAMIYSRWSGNVRWARNVVSTANEVRNNLIQVARDIHGARNAYTLVNTTSDEALIAAVRRAERIASMHSEKPESDLVTQYAPEPYVAPSLFSEVTYQQDAAHRAEAARQFAESATAAGMLSAGYIEVSAHSMAFIGSWGYARYFNWTWARFSTTVRDPHGTGSGWAGVDWPDWSKIDGKALAAIALEKCLKSRDPVAIEPGRYTTILEPQAVCDFVGQLVYGDGGWLLGWGNAISEDAPFNERPGNGDYRGGEPGQSLLGQRVVDERITISADPMDPELSFPPFTQVRANDDPMHLMAAQVYHPATWIEHGVLKQLADLRSDNIQWFGRNTGLPNAGAFRMSGGETSVEEMISTTKRGLLVTRFDQTRILISKPILCRGYTRDGLWLIEDGKISKPVKNMMFVESVLFALNNVEQLGPPQRVFHPPRDDDNWYNPQPVIVPPLKIKDFSFTALFDAV